MNIDGLDFEFHARARHRGAGGDALVHRAAAGGHARRRTAATPCTTPTRSAAHQIRDPQAWSKYLNETIDLWGDRADVMYGMHHWPVWGTRTCARDAREGSRRLPLHQRPDPAAGQPRARPVEIAEQVEFRPSCADTGRCAATTARVNHNVKATYIKYLGWFDGNPATLHTLPPEDAARSTSSSWAGRTGSIEEARRRSTTGEYRWVAEVVKHVVFADPDNEGGRDAPGRRASSSSATRRNPGRGGTST